MADDLASNPAEGGRVGAVMAHVRGRVAAGALGVGARLPSIRRCAQALGVSTSTVVDAYDRLVAEGEIASRRGAGFFVVGARAPVVLAKRAPAAEREIDPLWVLRHSLEAGDDVLKPGCGWLPESWMPTDALRRALRAQARGDAGVMVAYGQAMGYAPLRDLLARRLAERDIPAAPDRMLLTDSGTMAIDLIGRLFVRPGDAVLVDDPCYFNFLNTLRALGARVIGVPFTPAGPDLAAFEALARAHAPRLYLTTGALHNPTGVTPAPTVLHRLLKLVQAHDMVVVEDDIFADFEPEPTPRLAAFDGLERVIHIGSFSKTLSASMRCGYIAAKAEWIEALADLKLATSYGASELTGRVLHRLLSDGSHRRHVETMRTRLARARAETRARLKASGLTLWSEPRGGLFLWARLPDGLDAVEISRSAAREGVILAPGNVFSVERRAGDFLRFNVTHSPPRVFEVLGEAMRR
jgi:DNA-binding transcriptional MocR family regulator